MAPTVLIINLGGEGEVPGVINQQDSWVILDANWRSVNGQDFADLVRAGHAFLICPNDSLPFPDGSVDEVITNSVPVDVTTVLGLGVQSSEIRRILKSGGIWVRDGVHHYRQP